MYMLWTGTTCLVYCINSIVWFGNSVNWAPVWCDISTRITIGVSVAIPAASLCINRRLYHIASPTAVMKTKREKRRDIIVDLSICLGIPVTQMLLQYVVEGHRFDIFENFGCFPNTVVTQASFFLVYAWPLAIGCVSAVYGVLTIVAFIKRGRQLKELVTAHNNLQFSRYFRLMALANVEILCTVPLSIYNIQVTATVPGGVRPWGSWDIVHTTYSVPGLYPAAVYDQAPGITSSLELSRWLVVVCAFIFFGFFGFAEEAKKNYRLAFDSVAKKAGHTGLFSSTQSSGPNTSSERGGVNLPLSGYISKGNEAKWDSASAHSDKLTTSIYINDFPPSSEPKTPPCLSHMSFAQSSPPTLQQDDSLRVKQPAWDSWSSRRPSVPDAPKTPGSDSVLAMV